MIYAVLFEDDTSNANIRLKYMPDHLAFLESNASRIRHAGPLKDTESDAPVGGLWIVEADGPQSVQELVRADPFWSTGLRKSFRVLEWAQVFAKEKRRI